MALGDDRERRNDGDRHSGHAEIVAAPRRFGMRQALQRQDETHRGHQVPKGDEVGTHRCSFGE
ncbi:hypothetical protein D3C83_315380 [compost metagenome]